MCVVQAWEYTHLVGLLTVEFDASGVVQNCGGETMTLSLTTEPNLDPDPDH
jgi:2',3'-cyclic-nucleotide 2'-phosphodiesterase (5'-nucleotidase family)